MIVLLKTGAYMNHVHLSRLSRCGSCIDSPVSKIRFSTPRAPRYCGDYLPPRGQCPTEPQHPEISRHVLQVRLYVCTRVVSRTVPHVNFPACPPGACVRGSRPNEADSVDMFRGVYCLLHFGIAVRATTENMAGEDRKTWYL